MLLLPDKNGQTQAYNLCGEPLVPSAPSVSLNRIAYAAAHVITDPYQDQQPWLGRPVIDWQATLKFRHYLWDQGLHLAEAMDTAQRGMGVDWESAKILIQKTLIEAKAHHLKPRIACGASTDHLESQSLINEDDIVSAYSEQMAVIEKAGGQIILMASRAMINLGANPEAYHRVYERLLKQAAEPVILHWLGDMFDPELTGYWGDSKLDKATETVLSIINQYSSRIDGIKISLLDAKREIAFRRRLPKGVKLYTGDDFNYAELIAGDQHYYSHALLGIFAAIAPAASQALVALAKDDLQNYYRILTPTIALSREIFKAPTQFYKAGIAFLSWLNGTQSHFIMPRGFQAARSILHYAQVFRLADQANLLLQPELAEQRMQSLLKLYGISR